MSGLARDAATAYGYGDKPPRRRRGRPQPVVHQQQLAVDRPRPARPKPAIEVINYRRVVSGALRAFIDVRWNSAGLVFRDCAVIVGADGKAWCGLPSAPVIVDGRHYVINGKKQYRPAVEWRDRDRSDRFSERVLTLLLNIYPDALDADAEAAA